MQSCLKGGRELRLKSFAIFQYVHYEVQQFVLIIWVPFRSKSKIVKEITIIVHVMTIRLNTIKQSIRRFVVYRFFIVLEKLVHRYTGIRRWSGQDLNHRVLKFYRILQCWYHLGKYHPNSPLKADYPTAFNYTSSFKSTKPLIRPHYKSFYSGA